MRYRTSMELLSNLLNSYQQMRTPLCRKLRIPQTAFDILLFLANNPAYKTAKDIVEVRGIKANSVSINVDKLVQEGLLEREYSQEDRRVVFLVCTRKADKAIEEGQKLQKQYTEKLFAGVSEEEKEIYNAVLEAMAHNADEMMKGYRP